MPQSCLNVIFATRNLVRMEPAVDLYQTETLNVPVRLGSMEKLVQKLSMLALAILAQTMANVKLWKPEDFRKFQSNISTNFETFLLFQV